MSEVVPLVLGPAVVRTFQGIALLAAIGGFAACGENHDDGFEGRIAQASSESGDMPESDGQSGTEYDPDGNDGGDRPACPCGLWANPLRGTVLEVTRHIEGADFRPVRLGNVRLRVDELLGKTTGLEIGSEISSAWFGDLPCFYGCAEVDVGDSVLAFYRFPKPCINVSGDDCPLGDTVPGSIALTPWSDTRVVLAQLASGDFTVAIDDLSLFDEASLLDSTECTAQIGYVGDRLGPNDEEAACYDRAPAP